MTGPAPLWTLQSVCQWKTLPDAFAQVLDVKALLSRPRGQRALEQPSKVGQFAR